MKTRAYKTGFTSLETMGIRIPRRVRGKFLTGFTLTEMIIVVAIIAILVSVIIRVTKRFEDQSKVRLTQSTIAIIGNALEQFREFGFEYKDPCFAGLTFPLDCNDYNLITISAEPNLDGTLRASLYSEPRPVVTIKVAAQHDPSYSGTEALYFILSQVPDSRTTLNKIDKSLLTNKGKDKITEIAITIQSTTPPVMTMTYPLMRIIDSWGTPLRYDYYPDYRDYFMLNPADTWQDYFKYRNSNKKTFPVITSAGPDKIFDTDDDITSLK